MNEETVTLLCDDGLEREFELKFIFDYLDKTYAVLFQKLHGHWENDYVFLVDSNEEEGAENNFAVMEYIPPKDYTEPIEYREINPIIVKDVLKRADELIATGGGYIEDDEEFPF